MAAHLRRRGAWAGPRSGHERGVRYCGTATRGPSLDRHVGDCRAVVNQCRPHEPPATQLSNPSERKGESPCGLDERYSWIVASELPNDHKPFGFASPTMEGGDSEQETEAAKVLRCGGHIFQSTDKRIRVAAQHRNDGGLASAAAPHDGSPGYSSNGRAELQVTRAFGDGPRYPGVTATPTFSRSFRLAWP